MKNLRVNNAIISTILVGGMVFSGFSIKRDISKKHENNTIKEYATEEVVNYQDPAIPIEYEKLEEAKIPYEEKPGLEATAGVNVRSGASTDSEVIGGLTPGTKMQIIDHQNGWYKIDYFGRDGYVSDSYAKDTTIITGTPIKIVYCTSDTTLTTLYGTPVSVPKYEVGYVYEELPDRYLVSANNTLGYIPKYNCEELTGTFAIVDESDQRLDIYNNTTLVLSTPVVTGKDSTPTTKGCHKIAYKADDYYLTGEGYKEHVNHFLAYYDGEGLHDASWKMLFGNDGYHEKGSHGCVNMPTDITEEVNNNLQVGDTVVIKR